MGGRRRARIVNSDLSFLLFRGGIVSDAHFFLTVKFFLLAQRGIFESTFPCGKRAAVGAMDQAVGVQDFEILANRDLRRFESAGEFGNGKATLAGRQSADGEATFVVEREAKV